MGKGLAKPLVSRRPGSVSSALVEVDRPLSQRCECRLRQLRARGGGPASFAMPPQTFGSAPRSWRWTAAPGGDPTRFFVSSALVEVDRWPLAILPDRDGRPPVSHRFVRASRALRPPSPRPWPFQASTLGSRSARGSRAPRWVPRSASPDRRRLRGDDHRGPTSASRAHRNTRDQARLSRRISSFRQSTGMSTQPAPGQHPLAESRRTWSSGPTTCRSAMCGSVQTFPPFVRDRSPVLVRK